MLREAEKENVAYLQRVKLLEQRARELEEVYSAKIQELRTATTSLNCVEQECDQLGEEIRNSRQDYKDEIKVLREKHKKLVEQREQSHEAHTDGRKRLERHWKLKMKAAASANSETIDSLQRQLEISCAKSDKDLREKDEQVKELLVTTVQQTTVIEECNRVLSETKAQQGQTQRSYGEQRQLSRGLSHLDELIKELQRVERTLKSEISELQIALRDANDESRLLSDQVVELQEKLESERKDRSQWATVRLKLLADFCDEKSKLSSALNHRNDFFCIDTCWISAQKQKQPTIPMPCRKAKHRISQRKESRRPKLRRR